MKAYVGSFYKKNGSPREMTFVKLDDLPEEFLDDKIQGSGRAASYEDGMELVWDLEADNFRVFNHNRTISKPKAVHLEDF